MPANKALCQLAGTYKETGEGGLLWPPGGHRQGLTVKVTEVYHGEKV